MNRQYLHKNKGINWLGYKGLPAYTSNPIKGCKHLCTWIMPDGREAICYAKAMAKRIKRTSHDKLYAQGFEVITFHPEELDRIKSKKKSANIFIDSMSDLLGTDVPVLAITAVIETMRECPQHNFFLLTKNPSGLMAYGELMPPNVWVGISSPPSSMFGNVLNDEVCGAYLAEYPSDEAIAQATLLCYVVELRPRFVTPTIPTPPPIRIENIVIPLLTEAERAEEDDKQTMRDYFEGLRNRPITDGGKMHVDYFEPRDGKLGDIIDAPKLDDRQDDE